MTKEHSLSETQKNYLLVVHELTCAHGHAHIRAIAGKLEVSMPSVIEVMRVLEKKKMIVYHKRQHITLSSRAEPLVRELEKRQQVISAFARKVLAYSSKDSVDLARSMLHCVDETFCQRLKLHISEFTS